MKFVADKALPHISDAFSTIGEVILLPAGDITRSSLTGIDGLLTRTTVKVTPELLENTGISFVGTATIGTDHVDIPYLHQKGIHLASAPGCNATAVGEFVLTALLKLQQKRNIHLQDLTAGIIGAGNTGWAVKKNLEAIGIHCMLNDPPLSEQAQAGTYTDLDELIRRADIFCIHVPLTRSGPYPTFHLVGDEELKNMKPGSILINTSRGEAVDSEALKKHRHRLGGLVLDVWENEPEIDAELVPLVDIATPHIAGYSIEGKIRATGMIYREACRFFNLPKKWHHSDVIPEYGIPRLSLTEGKTIIMKAVEQVYDIETDDRRLRASVTADNPGRQFADLRSQYPFRREFSTFQIDEEDTLSPASRQQLAKIGFIFSNT